MAREENSNLVAIVDDDESVRIALQDLMQAVGLPVKAFASAEDFLNSGQQHHTACLITDVYIPGMSGLELYARLNAEHCRIPTIFITAQGDAVMRMQVMHSGALGLLSKPFSGSVLLENVRAALKI
jgi:FixJ family two-component response regulator